MRLQTTAGQASRSAFGRTAPIFCDRWAGLLPPGGGANEKLNLSRVISNGLSAKLYRGAASWHEYEQHVQNAALAEATPDRQANDETPATDRSQDRGRIQLY